MTDLYYIVKLHDCYKNSLYGVLVESDLFDGKFRATPEQPYKTLEELATRFGEEFSLAEFSNE